MRSIATEQGKNREQDRLRTLAQEVMSEISECDPSHSKELLEIFVSELALSAVEQERRELRRQRQAEGIAAARARGVRFGRRRIQVPDGFADLAKQWEGGWISATAAAGKLGMSRDTFLRRAKEFCAAGQE